MSSLRFSPLLFYACRSSRIVQMWPVNPASIAIAADCIQDAEVVRGCQRRCGRQRAVQAKLDRGYEDYLEGRISEGFWMRKSQEWETESATIESEISRLSRSAPAIVATGEKILELAKQAEFLYKTQSPVEQRRLLETVLSNCTFDRGSLSPTYVKPFDLLAQGHETGNWRGRRDSNPRPPA